MQNKRKQVMFLLPFLILAMAALVASFVYDIFANRVLETEGRKQEMEQEKVELELVYAYQNPQWNSAIENLVHSFEKDNPGIRIHYEISYEDTVYEDILSKRIARNELGDIVQLKTPKAYAAGGLLGEIDDDVAAQVSSLYSYDGKVYGVGAVESTWGVLYNKTLFDSYGLKEPETWEEFLDICGFLKRRRITPVGVGGGDLWHMEYWVNHFFRTDVISSDGDWLKKCQTGETSWTDEEPQEMIRHLCQLFQNGYVNENWMTTTDTSLSYRMSEGEMVMIYTGPWTAKMIEKLHPELELGWFYVPDENGMTIASDNLDTFWSVTASCAEDPQKYEAAMTFLNYFYSRDAYAQLCNDSCTFPLSEAEVPYERNSLMEDVWKSFEGADQRVPVYIGNEDTPEAFERNMLEVVKEILEGTRTPEEGLQEIQNRWEQCSVGGES